MHEVPLVAVKDKHLIFPFKSLEADVTSSRVVLVCIWDILVLNVRPIRHILSAKEIPHVFVPFSFKCFNFYFNKRFGYPRPHFDTKFELLDVFLHFLVVLERDKAIYVDLCQEELNFRHQSFCLNTRFMGKLG